MSAAPAAPQVDFAQPFVGAVWCDVVPRSVACPALTADVLLHAGPPYLGPPPGPVMNAAVHAVLFEGLAADEVDARRRLVRGQFTLQPAQDHGVVTPLAQVVSASMPLAVVTHHAQAVFGAMVEGSAPALRFGASAASCRDRLATLRQVQCAALAACVRRAPVLVDEVIRRAVAAGDDCHSRTAAANEALIACLVDLAPGVAAMLRAVPAFVLPVMMAAAAGAVRHHGNAIEALGGNGVDFGVRRRGEPAWRRLPATPPAGPRLPGGAQAAALPAIGDSVLVDYCGLGGQVDDPALRRSLIDPRTGILDPVRIAAAGAHATVAFNLAILDASGELGLIGRGVYHPPPELFA